MRFLQSKLGLLLLMVALIALAVYLIVNMLPWAFQTVIDSLG